MRRTILAALTIALSGCSTLQEDENEIEISVIEVPAAVIEAAQARVPGFTATEAEIEEEDGTSIYELSGTAGDTAFEIEVSESGEVLEVEEAD